MKPEPMYDGLPQRRWRGRIVEALRNVNGKRYLSLPHLGKVIKPNFKHHELRWLESLVEKLERDSVVVQKKNDGTDRVMLADK